MKKLKKKIKNQIKKHKNVHNLLPKWIKLIV